MSDTKAIKDIGREMWLDESLCASPLNSSLKFYRLYPSSDGECPTSDAPLSVRVYSEKELRELLLVAWRIGMMQVCQTCGDVSCGHNENTIDFDDWIKEQGI